MPLEAGPPALVQLWIMKQPCNLAPVPLSSPFQAQSCPPRHLERDRPICAGLQTLVLATDPEVDS